jgi:NAD(P)H-dependent FMN reductase
MWSSMEVYAQIETGGRQMARLVGISGSLRQGSYNTSLLKAATGDSAPGRFGTILSQNAWLPILRTLGTEFWTGGRLMVSRAGDVFDERGDIKDERTRDQVRAFLAGFAAFAGR